MEGRKQIKTDLQAKAAKLPAGKKRVKFSAGSGLYLLVNSSGKYWRYAYKYNGKRKEASLGVYSPNSNRHLSLKEAKSAVQVVKDMLTEGIDPNQRKKEQRQAEASKAQARLAEIEADTKTFELVARQWHATHKSTWADKHAGTILRRLENHVFPAIGSTPVAHLHKSQIADVISAIVQRGTVEMAKRISQVIRQVLEYASDKGLIDAIPMGSTKNLIPKREVKPMPSILEPKRIGEMMRAIYSYQGTFVVCQALKLLPLLVVRSGEFRAAEWSEFNLDDAIWTIPANRRKLTKAMKENPKNVHLVPLSRQAIEILRELYQLTGSGRYVFPSVRGDVRPMSENTINVAIHAMGFKGEMVGHGVRAMFSSLMNEQGFNADAIERQLAHVEKNKVRAAYNRSEYMEERTKLMQFWADYLDKLRKEPIVG